MIGKPRGKNKARPVYVYDASRKAKVYVGSRVKLADARELERVEAQRRARRDGRAPARVPTVAAWAARWLELYPRPEATTNLLNEQQIKSFVDEFGDVALDRIPRAQARAWAAAHRHGAKAAGAMLNDAIDAEQWPGPNPLARLRLPEPRGRRDIVPLEENEVHALADLALEVHGPAYGQVMRAAVLMAAYAGIRPGELFGLEWPDVDLRRLELRVERQVRIDGVHRPKTKQARTIALAPQAREALLALPRSIEPPLVFLTATGRPLSKGAMGYYWRPLRAAFTATLPASHWLPRRIAADACDQLDLYELRHFCGSLLADRGLSARDIADHLGNSPEVCERTYIHPYEQRARARVQAAFGRSTVTRLADRSGGEQMGSNGA